MATTVLDDITASDVGQVQITGIDDGSSSPSKHRPGHNDGRGDRGWHPKVRTILVLVVLLPVIATAILTGTSASSHWSDRRGAQIASVNATQLQNLAFARAKINDIRVPVMAVSFASSIGVSESVLSAVLHFDFASALKTDGEAMSKDPVFSSTPTMRADSAELHSMVASVEAGTIAFNTVKVFMAKFATDLDNLWYSAFNKLQADVEAWKPPGLFEVRLNALRQTYVAFLNGGYEIEGAIYVLEDVQGGSAKLELIQSAGVFSSATAQFQGHLGPQGQAAWTALQNSQSSRSFDQTILEGMGTAINGGQGAFVTDIPAAGAAMRNGLKYLDGLNAMVRGASGDLYTMAVNQSNSASRQFAEEIIFLFLLILVSIGGVIVAGRTLTRPLKRLSGAATRVHGGEFDLEKIPEEGPQEVVTTVTAFNEMTSTLKAVESKTMALAEEDLSHPELQMPLPGRTGQALQKTVDQLTKRIRERELQRQQLHEAATHDRLTGLFNRAAIFDFLEHDVTRRRNAGETVAVLFVDLDGLKPLNDIYGHEAGDAAICATAEALLEATVPCDVVGRLGGDEFLVVLCAEDSADGHAVAEKIRQKVSERSIPAGGKMIPLSASIGVALTECDSETDPMELVKQADEAMYDAKKAARMTREHLVAMMEKDRKDKGK